MALTHQSSPVVAALLVAAAIAVSRPLAVARDHQREAAKDPWSESETLAPSELAKMLESDKKPAVAYIGPHVLYRAGRIPGATLHGPTSEAEGLDDLKRWANALPRSETLVIYCGCCPIEKCPNIRPPSRRCARWDSPSCACSSWRRASRKTGSNRGWRWTSDRPN
jgi:hypothetical protein